MSQEVVASMSEDPLVVYESLCPVCGKSLTIEEIHARKCFNKNVSFNDIKDEVFREFEKFRLFFEETTSKKLRALQELWAKRILKGKSFAIESPPGTGKTTFGIVMALFFIKEGKKSYIVVPTTSLLNQIVDRIRMFVGEDIDSKGIVYYYSEMRKKEKEGALEKIKNGEYNVLITTAAFLSKHFDYLRNRVFDFIFVDDLDAVLKSSRNVDKILMLLGIDEKDIRRRKLSRKVRGVLIISTATTKQGRASMLFRSLLGFDVSQSHHTVRNVDDYYLVCRDKERYVKSLEIVKMLKDGVLVFTNNEEDAEIMAALFDNEGIKWGMVLGERNDLERFKEGEVSVLIGVARSYGKLVRGIDLPERIKYAVFVGVPGIKIRVGDVDNLSEKMISMLINTFRTHPMVKDKYYELISKPEEARHVIKSIFEKGELHYAKEGVVVKEDYLFFPDVRTYIQASGRTSRMYGGGITKGLSVVVDEKDKIDAFVKRAYWYDIFPEPYESDKVKDSIREVIKSRKEMEEAKEDKDLIVPVMFIVESPTKAKQISRFYGKPAVNIENNQVFYEISTGRYLLIITASLGHVVDLISKGYVYGVEVNSAIKPHYSSIKRCRDCGVQYVDVMPSNCECKDKTDTRTIINNVVELSKDVKAIIIATDPDNEGEKIGWDLGNFGGINTKVFRAEFHEVTKKAIDNALQNLRDVDRNFVKAQIVRRVEDRWIGYGLSGKLREHFKNRNLSAGRVQTPVLGWIIERYEKNKEKIKVAFLEVNNNTIELGDAEELGLKEGKYVINVRIIKESDEEKTPLPPYTTDEVLRDINRILKISSDEGMRILQTLFENGLITYHRTDSTRVSDKGLMVAKTYLGEEAVLREWKNKEGAHECIRPTRPASKEDVVVMMKNGILQTSDEMTWKHLAVYDLIFRRFMASQLPPIRVHKAKVLIEVESKKITKEIITKYEGKAYEFYPYMGVPTHLESGEHEGYIKIRSISKYPLYTESDVIRLMRERGIGRPSTYATILQKLFSRGYIVKKYNKLLPTKKGIEVYNYLMEHFSSYVSEETTRRMQEKMDLIEKGREDYQDVLKSLYKELKDVLSSSE